MAQWLKLRASNEQGTELRSQMLPGPKKKRERLETVVICNLE